MTLDTAIVARSELEKRSESEVKLSGSALQALQSFFSRAAVRGEMGVATARLVIAVLALSRYSLLHGLPSTEDPRLFVVFWVLSAGTAFSLWTLITLEPGPWLAFRLRLSTAFDAVIVGIIVSTRVVWPPEGWTGLSHVPETYFLVVAFVASGLRLSRTSAWIGVIGCWIAFILAVFADALLNDMGLAQSFRPLAIVLVLMAGASVIGITTVRRTRRLVLEGAAAAQTAERARQRLGVYLSEVVANEALEAEDLRVGGARQEVAVLFCDLRSFTQYAESLAPERLVTELNAYLDAMVRAIREESGVVDKFIGDAVMVVFGVPRPRADAARRAVRCAAAMRRALEEHNLERERKGRPPLRHGIGVHFGPAIVGNIGNADRLQYTVVGDVVNLASRLEGATKELGVPVLISGEAARAAEASEGRELPELAGRGTIKVRGRDGEIEVLTLAADRESGSEARTG